MKINVTWVLFIRLVYDKGVHKKFAHTSFLFDLVAIKWSYEGEFTEQ